MPKGTDVVELGFLDARGKLLEVAAFLDRADRHGQADDFRVVALRKALLELSSQTQGCSRAESFLLAMSDPTARPLDHATDGFARGAWFQDGA